MKHSILRRLAGVMAGCLLVLAGQAGATPRDDTEIYFNKAAPSKNSRPNALFILDTSLSMERAVSRETDAKSRIDTLKEAMSTLLDGASNVNVGLMRFTGLNGGPVLFPITDIDSDVSLVPGETAVYTALITSGENDARENEDKKVTLDDERIEDVFATPKTSFETVTKTYTVDDGTEDASESVSTGKSTITGQTLDLSADSEIGLLFDNEAGANKTAMRIPPNALIEEAYLEFEIDDATKKAAAQFTIQPTVRNDLSTLSASQFNQDEIESVRDRAMPDFYDVSYNLYFREHLSTPVIWNLAAKTGEETEKQAGYDVKSPDIKTLVQAIVSQGCTTPVTATTTAAAFSDAGCVWTGDKLGFRLANRKVGGVFGERVFESRDKTGASPPRLTVKYKQLATEGKPALTGLRFEGVRIPRGATVTSASLIFTPSADEKRGIKWKIQAEKAGDSAAFTATDGDLFDRTKTTAIATWTLPDWREEEAVESVDLKEVVKEVTDQSGWCGGNALSFLISRDGDEDDLAYKRKFFGFEASPGRAVRFKYSYEFDGRGKCSNASESKRNAARTDDAEQRTSGGRGDWNDRTLNLGTNWVGLRFPGVDVPPGATIERAYLELYARRNYSSATTYTIRGENTGNAAAYSRARRDITGRSYFSETVSWRPGRWSTGQAYRSADIKTLVQEQVENTGWRAGNALAFVIDKGGSGRQVASYDRRVGGVRGIQAPRLVVEYFTTDKDKKTFKTARERLEEIIDDIQPYGATPVQKTLLEAANYWRGKAVKYGLNRDDDLLSLVIPALRSSPFLFTQLVAIRKYGDRSRQTSRISHPGSYCERNASGTISCGNADTSGGKAFGVFNPKDNPGDCDPAKNPNLLGCISQEIKTSGTLNYISPFSSALECQRNFQVLLTDGIANQGSASAVTDIEGIIGKSCAANDSLGQKCSPDLAKFLADTDQSSLDGDQKIRTYTIGFALQGTDDVEAETLKAALPPLRKIATQGGGRFYSADTGDALLAAFEDILASESDSATLAASPVAANAFNRLFSRDNIYFGSFAPAPGRTGYQSKRWAGNLKKYRLCISAAGPDGDPATTDDNCTLGQILDAAGRNAIGGNGQFTDRARNLWNNSAVEDGNDVKQGGAGAGITDYTQRTLYTDISGSPAATAATGSALSATGFKITSTNWKDDDLATVRDAVCGKTINPEGAEIPAPITAGSDCEQLMEWMLGRDVDDEDGDSSTTDTRFVFSDVLHSSPIAVTYGQDSGGDFIDRLLIGANAGGLHFIDGKDGKEQWAFMPNALLARQGEFRANAALNLETGERHGYGLDATPVLRIEDVDNDGTIETTDGGNDKVHVYMAMRRGGNSIYALDISDRAAAPKFLWRIDGEDNSTASGGIGKGDFSRMGQTFSEPVLARINTTAGRKTVLIFGGGYDTSLDDDKPAKADGTKQPGRNFGLEAGKPNQGNAIYVVDADSGDLIFWIGHAADAGQGISASGADIKVPKMFYSIASNVNVFDSDGDGADDRLYVGDTAGNVWRVDLGADINPGGTNPEGGTVVGHFASLSTAGTLADERRIFYRPAVVQVRDTRFSNAERGEYDYVVVATGNRANPLATGTNDRLYALRDAQTGPMTGSNGLATGYPKTLPDTAGGTGGASTRPLNNSDLVSINPDLTTGLTGTTAEKSAEGWYLELKTAGGRTGAVGAGAGEKALAPPLVLSGNILFSTYLPVDPKDPCAASVGNGRAYNLGILSGRAGLNWDGSDPSEAKTTADAVFELKSGGIPPQVVPVYTTEGIKYLVGKESPPGITQNAAVKTYWYLERE